MSTPTFDSNSVEAQEHRHVLAEWLNAVTEYDETVQGYFKKPYSYIELKQQIKLIIAYWTECIHPSSDL
ncbi:hypothetical protein [Spirosoma endbachense]|uniref:Uncharacterized protein n=1 Tax=Spirosoma endbachense TaxID=2666025 RepID=A0A6P1VUD3_9BACT|nr:hypothetical protein [Spirosoma endbachense]QHV96315.1 hypothetical protein GJR95_15380 [Spirosoma endbachense]